MHDLITAIVTIFALVWNSRKQRQKTEAVVKAGQDVIQEQNVRQEGKIDRVEKVVNGERARATQHIRDLHAQVRELGAVPVDPPPAAAHATDP